MFSVGQMISSFTIGSRISRIFDGSGRSAGLWISSTSPSDIAIW